MTLDVAAAKEPTTEIVIVDGKKVFRTTTENDQTLADLQADVANLDTQIAATTARYISPLEARKVALQAKIDQLKA